MKKTFKKSLGILLAVIMAFGLFTIVPITARANTEGESVTLDVSQGGITISPTGYKIGNGQETSFTGGYVITGTTTTYPNNVQVTSGYSGSIVLNNLNIDFSSYGYDGYRPINLEEAGACTLTIVGECTLKASGNAPAIAVAKNKIKTTINGEEGGKLNAYGGQAWPAIGRNAGGNIEINNCTVNAYGGSNAAGIGGSWGFEAGTIKISNSTVYAKGPAGSGIGAGSTGSGGSIRIDNSYVTSQNSSGNNDSLHNKQANGVSGSNISITDSSVNGTIFGKGPNALTNNSTVDKTVCNTGNSIQVSFAASGGSGGYKYSLYAGTDGENYETVCSDSTASTCSYTALSAGTLYLKSVVKDSADNTDEKLFTVTVYAPLVNRSYAAEPPFAVGDIVTMNFDAVGGDGTYKYTLYLVDGEEQTLLCDKTTADNYEYTFSATGEYSFICTVYDGAGHSMTKTVNITVYEAVTNNSYLSDGPYYVGQPLTVYFDAEGGDDFSYKPCCSYNGTNWNNYTYMDGSSFEYTPTQSGTLYLRIFATNDNEISGRKDFEVTVYEPLECTSYITDNPTSCMVNDELTINLSSTGGSGDTKYTVTYKYNNGETNTLCTDSTASSVKLTTSQTGTLDICVTAEDSEGTKDEKNISVNVDKILIAGHSITLGGDIGVNFYFNLTQEEAANTTVSFTWNNKTLEDVAVVLDTNSGFYKATCPVAAAEMTCPIIAVLTINGAEKAPADPYSVRDYADVLLSEEYENNYAGTGYQSYENLTALVKTMLDYGAKAQTEFGINTDNLANADVEYTMQAVKAKDVPSNKDNFSKTDLSQYGLKYYGTSVIYLSNNTLRHYFRITDAEKFNAVKDSITFDVYGAEDPKAAVSGEKSGYVYFDMQNIGAADLDTAYALNIGNASLKYTVLDYSKNVLSASSMSDAEKALAAATYCYNRAANFFFA